VRKPKARLGHDTSQQHALLLAATDLEVGYNGLAILPAVSFVVSRGQFWAVLGRNGSGKTTMLRSLVGLHAPVRGLVERASGRLVSFVPQRTSIHDTIPARVIDIVAGGVDTGWSFLRRPGAEKRRRVEKALDETSTGELARHDFRELSEGQRQRVLLARALAASADVIVLDEPASAMDAPSETQLYEVLHHLRSERSLSVVLVSHHIDITVRYATHAIFCDRGADTVLAGEIEDIVATRAFRHCYALPDAEDACEPGAHLARSAKGGAR